MGSVKVFGQLLVLCLAFFVSARGEATGILFKDPDGRYTSELRFRMQSLLAFSLPDQSAAPADIVGQIRRLRLRFNGQVASPELRYGLQLSFSRQDMDWDVSNFPNVLRDAWARWVPGPNFELQFGLFKLPGNRQRVVSSGDMQFIDRSLVNRTFNLDRDFGIQTNFMGSVGGTPWSWKTAISAGEGRGVFNTDTGLAYTSRVEWLPFGAFTDGGDYFEGDLEGEPLPKLSVGIGASFNERTRRSQGQLGRALSSPRSFWASYGDAVFKWRGLSLYGEYMRRDLDNPMVTATEFVPSGQGWVVQGGYFFVPQWEVVTRYTQIRTSAATSMVMPDQLQFTTGVNYYLAGHRVKLQGDITWSEDNLAGATSSRWIGRMQLEMGI